MLYKENMMKKLRDPIKKSQPHLLNYSSPSGISLSPKQRVCDTIDLRIDPSGNWFYMNSPIFRTELTNLLSKHLVCDLKGQHWLITPSEVCRVEVDDAPFIAVELTLRNPGLKQLIEFRTNVDTLFVLSPKHPFKMELHPKSRELRPYVYLTSYMKAKLTRTVYYELVNLGVDFKDGDNNLFGVWSSAHFFVLSVESSLASETER